VHVALPDKTPSEQEYVPLPVWTYSGVLHVGVHELPLARLDAHVPRTPLAGAVTTHGFAPHAAVSVSAPALHDRLPDIVYPLSHVGVHELPLARLDAHVPKPPLVGAVTGHGFWPHATVSVSAPALHDRLPDIVYPLSHVGVHELPLARLDAHVPKPPLAGAVTMHGFAPHATVSVSVPAEHDRLPDIVYPLLHVGVHELPLARLDAHVPNAPLAGAVNVHGFALHAAVSVSVPDEHDRLPVTVYPVLHVGVHELPLARTEVHGDATPFDGAADARQYSRQHW
jgi:hypothetical protein